MPPYLVGRPALSVGLRASLTTSAMRHGAPARAVKVSDRPYSLSRVLYSETHGRLNSHPWCDGGGGGGW